jgi:hypothetical protein
VRLAEILSLFQAHGLRPQASLPGNDFNTEKGRGFTEKSRELSKTEGQRDRGF